MDRCYELARTVESFVRRDHLSGIQMENRVLNIGTLQLLLLLSYLSPISTSAELHPTVSGSVTQRGSVFVNQAFHQALDLVNAAYQRSRDRSKAALAEGSISANDLLRFFKHPVAETRTTVRAAELMETTIELIRQMVYTQEKIYRNATGDYVTVVMMLSYSMGRAEWTTSCPLFLYCRGIFYIRLREQTGPRFNVSSERRHLRQCGTLSVLHWSVSLDFCAQVPGVEDLLSALDLQTLAEATGCTTQLRSVTCSSSCLLNKYRTITGICNNRQHSRWGAANVPYVRWLPPEYDDGFSLPKGWIETKKYNGFPLPLVRTVSTAILYTGNANISLDSSYAHILVEWGQWIDHDMDLTPQSASTSSFIDSSDCSSSCHNRSPCFPIQIPDGDPRACGNESCMPFFRSAPACGSGESGIFTGQLRPREQLNSITSFVDASMVYGSTDSLARKLRNLTNDLGYLAINQEYSDNGLAYLPFMSKKLQNPCALTREQSLSTNKSDIACFLAGDSRANEHLGMQALHTIFLREHNRIVTELHQLNPHWSGETLYQEARKIMGAYHQIINWKDYVPKILGPDATKKHLPPYGGYDETVDPWISNVFATAAFRFAHVTIHPVLFRLDENYRENTAYPSISLHKSFFSPWRIVEEGGIDPIVRGIILNAAKLQTPTQMMPEELTEKLFQPKGSLALDLAALNLQRGRDHGLPSYSAWRRFCGLREARNISELIQIFNSTYLAKKLLSVYKTPDNIDVWIGAIAEPLLPRSRVGELLACLLGKQFQVLRDGDRFWWENEGVFTSQQREALSKVTLSRILCDSTRIQRIPVDVFSRNQYPNDFVFCNSPAIPSLNLSPWREVTETPCGEVPKVERAHFFFCKTSIHFECHAGLKLIGPSSLTCDALTGAWSSAAPTCQDNVPKSSSHLTTTVAVVCGCVFIIVLAVTGFQRYHQRHKDKSETAIKCELCIKYFSSKNAIRQGDSVEHNTHANPPST